MPWKECHVMDERLRCEHHAVAADRSERALSGRISGEGGHRTLALRATAKRLSPIQRIVCYSSSPAAPTDSFPVTFVVMMVVTTVETTEVTLDLIFLGMRA